MSSEKKPGTVGVWKDKAVTFCKDNFEIKSSRASKIVGLCILGVTLLFVILRVKAFTSLPYSSKWIILASALTIPFVLGIVTSYSLLIKNEQLRKIWYILLFFLLPFVSITMTEALNNVFIYNMTYLGFFGNYVLILIMYFIVFGLSGSLKLSCLIINPILFGFAVANSYIMDFRGTPFIPMDFLGITTAVGVANTYNFAPGHKVVIGLLLLIFLIIVGIKIKKPAFKFITKIIIRVLPVIFSVVIITLFYATNIFSDMGIKPDFWNQARGYKNYGFAFSFFANTKYLYMSVPDQYDPNSIKDYVDHVVDDDPNSQNDDQTPQETYQKPNVICIMNESLADLSVLGNLETNEDYMPFIRSLSENTIKGNLLVPVIGAGTSNTEFEFLTGHTTAFLPSGSNAYMLYVKNPRSSLVSTMEGQGYSSMALHPYYAIGWKRTEVYRNFGFNLFKSLEDIMDISLMKDFQDNGNDPDYLQQIVEQAYPGSNMLIRQYVSDSYNYKLLEQDYENRDKSVPYFAFNVTMQNHGGYTNSCVNFDESIYATSVSNHYEKANKYLSLIKKSDDAFKELVTYFSNVDEPTVICMFGDHQPSVESQFISEVIGVNSLSNLTIEQEQSRHCTPFIIWANYDIPEQEMGMLSANYLSSYVLQTAGIKMTEYNKYLLKLSKTLPVIDTTGYIDNQGTYYKWSDSSPYTDLLDEYERIQYNAIFDTKNVDRDIFYINNFVAPEETETESTESSSGGGTEEK